MEIREGKWVQLRRHRSLQRMLQVKVLVIL